MGHLIPTGKESLLGRVYYMPISKDLFVHFTTKDRAAAILASGKLLMRPPYEKSGIDAVNAVSAVWGWYTPRVQTNHLLKVAPLKDLVTLVFQTNAVPERGYVEEVIWKRDVPLSSPKIVSLAKGIGMLKRTPERLLDDSDEVTYDRGKLSYLNQKLSGQSLFKSVKAKMQPVERFSISNSISNSYDRRRSR